MSVVDFDFENSKKPKNSIQASTDVPKHKYRQLLTKESNNRCTGTTLQTIFSVCLVRNEYETSAYHLTLRYIARLYDFQDCALKQLEKCLKLKKQFIIITYIPINTDH